MPAGVLAKTDTAAKKRRDASAVVEARESELRQAEANVERANAALEEIVRRAHVLHAEAEKAEKVRQNAEAALEKARAELGKVSS